MRPRGLDSGGYSLVELMVAMAVMTLISSGVFLMMSVYQRSHTSNMLRAGLHAELRNTIDLLAQEVSQAGLLNFTPTTTTAAVTGSGSSQTVNVASAAWMFVGEKLLIDEGSSQEAVATTAVGASSITGVFTKNHASGAAVSAVGVFSQGVLSTSTATQLQMVGDFNADGTLAYVRYDCSTAAGTLTRSITPLTSATMSASVVLVDNVVANPGGTACFRYTTTTVSGYTFVTGVSVTLTATSGLTDPALNAPFSETKQFFDLAPRNVILGVGFANAGATNYLQPTPPGVPLT